jgi:hypothetical protein
MLPLLTLLLKLHACVCLAGRISPPPKRYAGGRAGMRCGVESVRSKSAPLPQGWLLVACEMLATGISTLVRAGPLNSPPLRCELMTVGTALFADDCWTAKNRSSNGTISADPVKFPNGVPILFHFMQARLAYIHNYNYKYIYFLLIYLFFVVSLHAGHV